MKSILTLVIFCLMMALPVGSKSQGMAPAAIDKLVAATLKEFDVPGIAVGIVKDGKLIFSKGYGVRSLDTRLSVDENTLFGIASNSKAFTAAALGMLADEGKLGWDDKVADWIPGFRMYDPYVSMDFTIRDLLTHRSGLGLGAGDLMIWPDGSDFTRGDIINNLRYLKQVSPFRSKYDYDNNLYIIAGEVIAKASGLSWEEFVSQRILQPLGMTRTAPSFRLLKDTSNVIAAHCPIDGKVQVIPRTKGEVMNAAAGIYSSVADLSKWVIMHLNRGTYGADNKQLISKKNHQEMLTPQTLMRVNTNPPYHSHFAAYGLGFRLSDVKGNLEVSHTGGLGGMVTQVIMYPELSLGIIVLTNQQVGAAFTTISNTIKDSYLGVTGTDWLKVMSERTKKENEEALKITGKVWEEIRQSAASKGPKPDESLYLGTYRDPWFGDVFIERSGETLQIRSKRSPALTGELIFYRSQTFIAKWKDRSLDADAFVLFTPGYDGKASGMTMKAISPLTDFSYDFHDLNFVRVEQ